MCPSKRKPSYGKKSKGELVLPMDPITAAAFPCCTGTDRHCCRKLNDFDSLVTCLRWQPSSLRNEKVSGPKGPAVSIATGGKMWH